jgi:ribose-phosphate pyrophosphokinase
MVEIGKLKVFSGNANLDLAHEICDYLGIPLGRAEVSTFSDGETSIHIDENVRGGDVFVIQPTCPPVNHNLIELLTLIDALNRSSARRITAVIPYFGYARQDRKVKPRVPISAKLVSNLITTAGADRVLTMDLHAGQIQGFFDIPVDHLFAAPVIIDYFKKRGVEDTLIVSPDPGGVERARAFAKRLGIQMAIIDKRRGEGDLPEVMNVIGDVEGKEAIIVDDIIDTGGTLIQATQALLDRGATKVYASCTHPVFSGNAVERIDSSDIKEVVVTNTIPLRDKRSQKVVCLSIAELLAKAIKMIHTEASVSSLFV